MSAAGPGGEDEGAAESDPDLDPEGAASALRDAGFVRLVATADGDALAATGLLARALAATDVPYQASLSAVPEPPSTDPDCTVAVGHAAGDVTLSRAPLSVAAADIARALRGDAGALDDDTGALDDDAGAETDLVDPVLALAGATCAGVEPDVVAGGALLEATSLERRPGVALPTADPVAGLAGSTLVHAGFSGDETAAAEALAGLDEPVDDAPSDPDAGRRLASLVALSGVRDAPPRAAEAVERALRPYDCEQFETLGGFADVLDAVARERPGTGVALALGADVDAVALEAWRAHGERVHGALRSADTARYDGVYAARVATDAVESEGPRGGRDGAEPGVAPAALGTIARLLFAYRSPEPVALAVTDGAAAVAADAADAQAPAGDALCGAARALGGRAVGRERNGIPAYSGAATFDGAAADYVAAFRRAL